ncbi:hypothetical protein OROGR_006128 [Orobanche gracilis]
MISDEMFHVTCIVIESGKAQEAGTSEGGSEYLPFEEIYEVLSSDLFFFCSNIFSNVPCYLILYL